MLPCGCGKTLVAAAATKDAGRLLVFTPTIALLEQTLPRLAGWHAGAVTAAVCSDPALAQTGDDDDVPARAVGADLVTTDPDVLAEWLAAHPRVVVGCTYTSAPLVGVATRQAGVVWDAVVLDEAHRTAGLAGKPWAVPLDDTSLPARFRLSLTATPREISVEPGQTDADGVPLQVGSMADPDLYGPLVSTVSMRQAIEQHRLSDYRIAVVGVAEKEVLRTLESHRGVTVGGGETVDVPVVASQIALQKYLAGHAGLRSMLVFCNRISASKQWADLWPATSQAAGGGGRLSVEVTHVDGGMPSSARATAIGRLGAHPGVGVEIVSNCRVLSEGVDVPALDAVLFAQPRQSAPEIVQIVGRCLRPHPDGPGHRSLIILPVMVPDQTSMSVEEMVAGTSFSTVCQVLTALAWEDIGLYKTLACLAAGRRGGDTEGLPVEVEVDVSGLCLDEKLASQIRLRVLNRTTSPWSVFAVRMGAHVRAGGSQWPRRSYVTAKGRYPLGERAAAVRQLWAAGRLHPMIARFAQDTVPGWDWAGRPSRRRPLSFDDYLGLVRDWVARTGDRRIAPWTTVDGPGGPVRIGQWVDQQQRHYQQLPVGQQQALNGLGLCRRWA